MILCNLCNFHFQASSTYSSVVAQQQAMTAQMQQLQQQQQQSQQQQHTQQVLQTQQVQQWGVSQQHPHPSVTPPPPVSHVGLVPNPVSQVPSMTMNTRVITPIADPRAMSPKPDTRAVSPTPPPQVQVIPTQVPMGNMSSFSVQAPQGGIQQTHVTPPHSVSPVPPQSVSPVPPQSISPVPQGATQSRSVTPPPVNQPLFMQNQLFVPVSATSIDLSNQMPFQRNAISPAPPSIPRIGEPLEQPARPSSAPVPKTPSFLAGLLPFSYKREEIEDDFQPAPTIPFVFKKEVPDSGYGDSQEGSQNNTAINLVQEKVPRLEPTGVQQSKENGPTFTELLPRGATNTAPAMPEKSSPSPTPLHQAQHTFEAKQRYSPSQAHRTSPAPYYNPRSNMSPAPGSRGVSPLVHSSSSPRSSPAPVRSREHSPVPCRSREVSPGPMPQTFTPVPSVALVVPDIQKREDSTGANTLTTPTATLSRPKPDPLNLPTSSLLGVPIASPTHLGGTLKSAGLSTPSLATPSLAHMTPNTLTGYSLPTPMMLASPVNFGPQRTPVVPLHFWSSLSPVATLSPRVSGNAAQGPHTFQFPTYMNGHMPPGFSPVVTIPAFTSYENLHSPTVTVASPTNKTIHVP